MIQFWRLWFLLWFFLVSFSRDFQGGYQYLCVPTLAGVRLRLFTLVQNRMSGWQAVIQGDDRGYFLPVETSGEAIFKALILAYLLNMKPI